MFIVAHAEELHESAVDSVLHVLGPWYVAIPVILIALAAIGYLAYLISGKNAGSVIIVETMLLLIVGFTTATIYPLLSVAAITVGIILAGFMAFAGLAAGK